MQYLIGFSLTLLVSLSIIILMKKKIDRKMSRTLYSQKDMHELFKYFFSIDSSNNKKRLSQLTKHTEKSMIKVMVMITMMIIKDMMTVVVSFVTSR